MYKIAFLSLLAFVVFTDVSLAGEPQKIGVQSYQSTQLQPGDIVFELQDDSGQNGMPYVVQEFLKVLTASSDPENLLGASAPRGRFVRVALGELASSENIEDSDSLPAQFQFYLKLGWQGRAHSDLGDHQGLHVIKAQGTRNEDGLYKVEILALPDLYLLGTFFPGTDISYMFGRNAIDDGSTFEFEIRYWFTKVIEYSLNSHFLENATGNDLELR